MPVGAGAVTMLEASGRAAGEARAFVGGWLRKNGLGDDAVGTAELVASELVTNAWRHGHTRGSSILTRARLVEDGVVVSVTDRSARLPVERELTLDDEGGRGLAILTALGVRWEAEPLPTGGKTVHALIPHG
ncbi:ATP-binding protein [Actinomadura flavalba]|uniref:ATP-binding protein n=1 Tax=Actinomadura flavalba TaxID=1120938 RepID=UPI00037B7C51|nr:ATP-binding protein [Actinomadura flavalba]